MDLIGRKEEKETFKYCLNSSESKLIASYGRRRVGKTFLVRNYFKSQIKFEIAGLYYYWTGTIPTWSVNGQVNPNHVTGNQIYVEFHDYPYYPQNFNICVRSPQLQSESICMKVTLKDCNNDDPDCEDVFEIEDNLNEVPPNNSLLSKGITKENTIDSSIQFVKVYDISGRIIYSGQFSNWSFSKLEHRYKGLIFASYLDKNMNTLETEKYFIVE